MRLFVNLSTKTIPVLLLSSTALVAAVIPASAHDSGTMPAPHRRQLHALLYREQSQQHYVGGTNRTVSASYDSSPLHHSRHE